MLYEVRWHGRAGQGVITVSRILAEAALREGKYVQAFPEFGAERLGAPVNGFTRISEEPIKVHSHVYSPGAVVVIDPTLMGVIDVAEGLMKGGSLIVNSKESPEGLMKRLSLEDADIFVVDATRIALEVLKRPIYNTPMLGALIKALPIVSFEKVREAVIDRFPGQIGEMNVEALKRAYGEVRGSR